MSVPGPVAVVGEEPSERHVVTCVAVYSRTGGELIATAVAIEGLARAAVVLLALVVAPSVLVEHESAVGLLPVVAVVGVEVSLVEPELGQQHGVASELIVRLQEAHGGLPHHHEHVEMVVGVRQAHTAGALRAEVVTPGAERIPQYAVAHGAPVERRRRRYAAVYPVVGVLYGYALAAVREPSVLHAAAVEVLAVVRLELQRHAFLSDDGL